MYETASSIEYIIGTDQAIGATYYVVDNIRLGKAIDETKCVDFSSGKLASDSNYVFTYRNNQTASWKTKSFIGTGNGVDKTNSGYDYTVKSAGLRSFKAVLLGGYCSFGINGPLVESIPDGGSLMFDVNVSSNISSVAWTGSAASWVYTGWRTITITKANLAAATKIDTYLYPICVINGTSTGNMYFDNFRIKGNSTVTDFDFEDAAVNTSYPKYICNTANVGAFTYADVNYGFYLETSTSAFSVGVSTDQAYTGSKSVKFSSTSNYAGYSALHLNETFCNGAPAAGIEFNVLALNGGTMHDMLDVNGVKVGKAGGKWQTVRIAKANIGTKGTILSGNNMLAGDYYFDNVHYAA